MDKEKIESGVEKRKFIRLTTIFPVEYLIVDKDSRKALTETNQAFTKNVCNGGMCLEITNLKDEFVDKLRKGEAGLSLVIEVPFSRKPMAAFGKVVWIQKIKESYPNKYLLGTEYELISEKERKKIVNYANAIIWRPRLLTAAFLLFVLTVIITGQKMAEEKKGRETAQKEVVMLQKERRILERYLEELDESKRMIEDRLVKFQNEKLSLERETEQFLNTDVSAEKVEELQGSIVRSQAMIFSLEDELNQVLREKELLAKDIMKLRNQIPTTALTVLLKSGRSLEGVLVNENTQSIKMKVAAGLVTLNKNDVVEIKHLGKEESVRVEHEIEEAELVKQKEEEKKKRILLEKNTAGLVFLGGKLVKEEKNKILKGETSQLGEEDIAAIIKNNPKVNVQERKIYVNGRAFFIKGIAYNISYPGYPQGLIGFDKIPFEIFEQDFKLMKEMGVNTIRSYEPLPDKLLDLAEKYGLFVIETVVFPGAGTNYTHAGQLISLKETAINNVLRHKNRPGILMWSIWDNVPFDESFQGNIVERYGKKEAASFLKDIYGAVKSADDSRPVTAANLLDVEGDETGFDFLDVIGINTNLGICGNDWGGKTTAEKSVDKIYEISLKFNKPVFIAQTGFSSFLKSDTQENVLKIQLESLTTELAGIVVLEWADQWWKAGNPEIQDENIEEYWGILTADRKPKPGFSSVKDNFQKMRSFFE